MTVRSYKFKDIARVVTGGTPKKHSENYDGDIPFVTPGDLGEVGVISSTTRTLTRKGADSIRPIPEGSVMVCCIGATVGKVGIASKEVATNQQINSLVVDQSIAYPKYVYYFCKTLKDKLMAASSSTTMPIVNKTTFSELEIPLPPLEEQKRIAAILDKADAIRQKRKQAIALADEFLRSVFLEMFGDPVSNPKGWEEPILSDIADVRSGVTKGKKLKEGTGVTLPYMRVANVQDGYLDLSSIQMITVSEKEAEKCKLLSGDILLTEGGDPDKLGRGHVWNDEIENCIHQNHIFSVRVKNKEYVRPAFLSAVIGSQRGKRYFLKVGKQTTGIATINKTVLSEFCPIIPPLELQDAYLDVVRRIKKIQKKEGYHDATLFPSVSQKAFSGQL
ncbi:restriction endonuclease subunit S [Vibrio vulnificus]|uniref:restriction endonuclease subunit S n=2 Tax=Vibrio vulnificus TaxID=672 RepID=UPI000CD262F8|nr:restriction endonuclease subunit S [Vibrio vulnificus]EGS1996204.1 restriction endonuclease subunit S [Vibrio vulnificus]EHV9836961.1 restriction endonuclease subunit S [Vibrio vulnificus]EIF3177015.1 restriction endonuclease subunit S [Vibrio vulnificus]EIJ0955997.1 restriction endonuclease subunit S [Vibrio vulnificus]EIJ0961669.1 restriction endonuclease subunit S [Vibrio vulnificus]